MRLWFTGSRQGMTTTQKKKVQEFLTTYKEIIKEIHHGDEIGAEQLFHSLCFENGLMDKIIIHPLNIRKNRALCKAPIIHEPTNYEQRRRFMVEQTNFLLVTVDSFSENIRNGCWSIINITRKYKIPIQIIFPDGTITSIVSKHEINLLP